MSTPTKKYQVEDREILIKLYNRLFWHRLVKRLPRSLKPNTITICGQIAGMLGLTCTYLGGIGYTWMYALSGVLWITYLTADNIDGQHARNTGQASVLGEFLDHGLDGLASGGLLITTGLLFDMEGIWMLALVALGALGFIVTFWEQYRTGTLVLGAINAAEGATVVVILGLLKTFADEPAWLRFSIEEMTVATYVMIAVLLGYAGAIAGPVWRVWRQHPRRLPELLPMLTIAGVACLYPVLGARGFMPAVMVSLFAAETVCRMVILRHRGVDRQVVTGYHLALALPLIPLALEVWTPDGWAAVALGLSVLIYGWRLVSAGLEINRSAND